MLRPFGVKSLKLGSAFAVIAALALAITPSASAQNGGGNNGNNFLFNVVGGVRVSPDGVLASVQNQDRIEARDKMRARTEKASADISVKTEMRMVSLAGIQAALADAQSSGKPLAEDVLFMAGLQRIQYVFLYPERNDIVLAGPGEGWMVSEDGSVVGETTGLPVIHLEDFLIAMQTSRQASEGYGISVSIDPTAEGRRNLDRFLSRRPNFSPAVVETMRQALGQQEITLTGVPEDSRFARVLVAADYQMKRMAMKLDPAPIANFPSYLDILQAKRARPTNMMPRWWLATDYDSLGKSEDGLAWELKGQGVKCMTEDDIITDEGEAVASGRKNVHAQSWATMMNERYMELAKAEPVFGDLRNIMDLSVVAALIDKENMLSTVGLEAPAIFAKESTVQFSGWPAPKKVDTQCSFIKTGREWIVTASGGVQVDSWAVADKATVDQSIAPRREQAESNAKPGLFWN